MKHTNLFCGRRRGREKVYLTPEEIKKMIPDLLNKDLQVL